MTTILGILQIYPFCKFGSETPDIIQSIGDSAYCSDWYKLSILQQKYVQMIIRSSHTPKKISGYGLIDCNFVTYVRVSVFQRWKKGSAIILFSLIQFLRGSASYFLMLKNVSK